jgi:hypothetical protein
MKDGDFTVDGKPRSAYPVNWQAQEGDVITREVIRDGTPVQVSYTLERSSYSLIMLVVQLPAAILAFICAPWLLRRWGAEPGVQVFTLILMATCFTLVASGVTNVIHNIDGFALLIVLPLLLHLMLIFPEPLRYFQDHPRHIWLIYLPVSVGLIEFLIGVGSVFNGFNLAIYSFYGVLLVVALIFKWWRRDLKRYRALWLLLMPWIAVIIGVPIVQALYVFDDYSHIKAWWGGSGILMIMVNYGITIGVSIFCVIVGTLGVHRVQRMIGRSVEAESIIDADSSKTLIFT